MSNYSLAHLTDGAVLSGLKVHVARERDALADVLAHIAEIEERKLHVPAGYGSMHDYCVHELHFSKDAAYKRIHAARTALEYPAIFERVAEGALGLRVVNLLTPYLTPESAKELLVAASFKTREQVQELLAERFPQAAVETTIEPIAQQVGLSAEAAEGGKDASEQVPGPVQGLAKPPEVAPLAADLYKLQLTMTGRMYTKLRRAVELFGRRKPAPDEAEILELGLDLLVRSLEKKKFAATDKPRAQRRGGSSDHIPAEVQRKVWERDGSRCTFVSDDGVRCPSCTDLEFDHIIPRARGGRSDDAGNLRLRCRAHNQYEAERMFGKQFMQNKRDQAKAASTKRKAEREAKKALQETLDNDELMPALRNLGFGKEEARHALTECGTIEGEAIQARLKRCLTVVLPPHRKFSPSAPLHSSLPECRNLALAT